MSIAITKFRIQSKAFTLVEVMIVVVIVGLLTALAIPAFHQVRKASQMNVIKNNVRMIVDGANLFFLENGVNEVLIADLMDASGAGQSYMKSFEPVAEEVYPLTVEDEVFYTVTNTPIGDYSVVP